VFYDFLIQKRGMEHILHNYNTYIYIYLHAHTKDMSQSVYRLKICTFNILKEGNMLWFFFFYLKLIFPKWKQSAHGFIKEIEVKYMYRYDIFSVQKCKRTRFFENYVNNVNCRLKINRYSLSVFLICSWVLFFLKFDGTNVPLSQAIV
jgi:hypothetical protein